MVQAKRNPGELVSAGAAGSGPRRAGGEARPRVRSTLSAPAALVLLCWAAFGPAGCGDDDDGDADVAADADVPGDGEVGADADGDAEAGEDVAPDVPAEADAEVEDEGGVDGEADADVPDVAPAMNALVVLTSDYATGGVSVIDLDTVEATPEVVIDAATAHGDAMLACAPAVEGPGERVFHVVERLGSDRVRRFRVTATGVEETEVLDLEDGTNPQDAVPLSVGQWAVPLYERNGLAFAAGDLSEVEQVVDLSPLADSADGLCEMHRGVEWGGRLYVSLQRLDRGGAWWVPTGPGVLAVVELSGTGGAHELVDLDLGEEGVQGVALVGANPVGPVRLVGEGSGARLMVGTVGEYGVSDGGLEAVRDPASGSSSGFVVREEALGGDLGDWVVLAGDAGFAVVTVGFAEDRLVRFDAGTGEVEAEPLLVSGGYTLSGLADAGGGRLAVADRTEGSAGVRLFDAATGSELTAGAIGVGLPPVSLCRP